MIIQQVKVMTGPNYWSVDHHKLIVLLLNLEETGQSTSIFIQSFYENLIHLFPSMEQKESDDAQAFLHLAKTGVSHAYVAERIALEIQTLAGLHVSYGRTTEADALGNYYVIFEYEELRAGKYAAEAAVKITNALAKGEAYDITADIDAIKKLANRDRLGPSTASIVNEATARNIPHIRLDGQSLIQLGYGAAQKRIQATIASTTGHIAVDLASDKEATKQLLDEAEIPVPKGEIVYDEEELNAAIKNLGYPLAIKPYDGNHGKGATTNINNLSDAVEALKAAQVYSKRVICEKYITGDDYRALVINYKFIAAAKRTPASVTGDGEHTIQQLIEIANTDPKRGIGHDNVLTQIIIDEGSLKLLGKKGYNIETVLAEGEQCMLKATANLSTGGTATDVTDDVHPANISMFERIARLAGLDICGIDIIATSLETPVKTNGGAVLEINAAPGFRMHLDPTHGSPRNVATPVVDMLFPYGSQGMIPIVAVTGTNGKTTTTRLMAHMAKKAGHRVGYTTTEGIYIQDELLMEGDCSGPSSAQFVLKIPAVDFAVLECARGGILRFGLGFPYCHVAIVTNVAEDHLGLNGIDTIEKLAKVKSVVAESVWSNGYAILNADDDLVYDMKDRVKGKVALFSMYENNIRVKRHCQGVGLAAIYSHNYIIIQQGSKRIRIDKVVNIPVTFGGKAPFNIANVLGSTLAAYICGFNLDDIRQGLHTFIPSPETTPGRMNMFEFRDFKVMVDYAHNQHGINAVGKFIKEIKATVKVGVVAGVGDRRDCDLMNVGEEAAKIFDEIIIRLDSDLRGRTADEIFTLVAEGIRRHDPNKSFSFNSDECAAVEYAIQHAVPGAFIVVLTDNINNVIECVRKHQEKEQKQLIQPD